MGFFLFPVVFFVLPELFKLIMFAVIIANVFFILSFYQTAQRIPKEFHIFSIWFSWLFIIPLLGIVFKWMMLPFALPQALREYQPENAKVQQSANKLFNIGIAYVIALSFSLFFSMMAFFIVIATIILLVIYWVEIIKVRKRLPSQA